ncbi:ABC transporter, CydDC cysteine exporter (CydDC-E) family, permease/ATP-binding protein CydD OS=Tsukamurella paurometabola (strain ATCC 8368 / DSM / CCUG 35730 / CIP 100753 / JCM 10117 / KCTC 9821 / NBRC 16120 /NCIMB 702349 / NCTC 13040) OX=521096 GN=Tpau_3567 PE=4 SV=1 [Tsukamurella paurometabola]|uniref:ABC transporter, CydDC cysteine exporter (CydDC-E) family, permease/ATP-binding protein CydD n=1 Tax=Tsukamurella paurometabola (strain ATCC 8368 / DSM 20162 / CCUG 35730 / CIP 100753 / JCM 10117 / KCTC 9821 / NBRC 16120 / NCIMB 702349 / NCTC 13040) TaxID=521096 RepID=D5UXC7_TSUPD|nr:thiol reductant ABC exporter subunit CydD [Tsukamurella paurometabola]ADG80146.1 ABC transporter, CydDC cysteine exporter (CydDC- E) family, permease/ATP-binding protein CydD [Tsukamurella paurometabola DSM 20162]SUP38587.1 ATP-binding/permease protein CydD [Tsukamurella paurometabola]
MSETAVVETGAEGTARKGPVDPRLLRYARASRGLLAIVVACGVVDTAALIALAYGVATVLARLVTGATAMTELRGPVIAAAVAAAVRVAVASVRGRIERRAADRTVSQLRSAALGAVGPGRLPVGADRDELRTALTRGLDDLPPYLTGYLPALALSVIATPALVLVIFLADPVSGAIALGTLPLLPIFMVLIGLLTRDRTRRRLAAMSRLSARLLDLVAGLPTLRALGRERGPERSVRELGDRNATETMGALRIAFLSSMALELLATLCVALVAVSIGLRLVFGNMDLLPGVFALILAPEVYRPLRSVGAQFHAAEQGLEATSRVFALLDAPAPAAGPGTAVTGVIEIRGVTVCGRDGAAPSGFSAVLRPGTVTVLTGPNGSGKSTLLTVLAGLTPPDAGTVTVDGTPLTGGPDWWNRVAWCPQHPYLEPGTLAHNFTLLGAPGPATVPGVVEETGLDEVVAEAGWGRPVGVGGSGLSAGQRQRLALARTLAVGRDVLLFDEPTAHLDPAHAQRVLAALRTRAAGGALVVIVGHDAQVLAAADHVLEVSRA